MAHELFIALLFDGCYGLPPAETYHHGFWRGVTAAGGKGYRHRYRHTIMGASAASVSVVQADMKAQVEACRDTRKTVEASKAIVLCKQLRLNTAKLTDEEWWVLMKVPNASAQGEEAEAGFCNRR